MSRVMRRTPYMGVRFAFKTLADGTWAYVAVKPCRGKGDTCSAYKTRVCKNCPPATNRDIERAVYEIMRFHHNFDEDYGRRLRSLESLAEWYESEYTKELEAVE